MKIPLTKLHDVLKLDPYYGIESAAIESIINATIQDALKKSGYEQFDRQFTLLPCRPDKQLRLIHLWCRAFGLPIYKNDEKIDPTSVTEEQICNPPFDIDSNEFKSFLRAGSWPLPTTLFPDEKDTTDTKVAAETSEFDRAFEEAVKVSELEDELREIRALPPRSAEGSKYKKKEIRRLENAILNIQNEKKVALENENSVEANENRILLTGEYWNITFQGNTGVFKNTKGLRYIEYLIRHQGKEINVTDLYFSINPPEPRTPHSGHSSMTAHQLEEQGLFVKDLGDAGEILTPEEKNRFEQRLQVIQERIDEASEYGEEEKAAELEQEQEEILAYLAKAIGLGGQSRKASSGIERIRKTVTNCIRKDIKKITSILPGLGNHLDRSIRTGTSCQYSPYPLVEWLSK